MSYQFKLAGKRKLGYEPNQVNEFLDFAKEQFANLESELIDAKSLRNTRFRLVKNGYSISAVDAAMEKLEDVFATRELERSAANDGIHTFENHLQEGMELISNRVKRKKGRRFKRRFYLYRGYNRRQVDSFCAEVAAHLELKKELAVRAVRLTTFRTQRGGYAEYQVDAFIEKLVEVLQREDILKTFDS